MNLDLDFIRDQYPVFQDRPGSLLKRLAFGRQEDMHTALIKRGSGLHI